MVSVFSENYRKILLMRDDTFSFSKAISGNTICQTQVCFFIVTRLQSAQPKSRVSISDRGQGFCLPQSTQPGVRDRPASYSRKAPYFLKDKLDLGVKMTSNFFVVPSLRITGAVTPHPHITSWCAQGQFYIYHFVTRLS